MKKRRVIMFGIMFLLVSISFASAYKRLCLTHGESVPSEEHPRYTCEHDLCQLCVNDNNYPTHTGYCSDFDGCVPLNVSTIDSEPPNITVISPLQGGIYNSASVIFNIKADEECAFYYLDNINGRGRWKRVCSSCKRYENNRRFNEGINNITIKCVDNHGNSAMVKKEFRIDSKKPRITKTYPKRGFADGSFEVQFKEENPALLTLYYGNSSKTENKPLNLTGDCYEYKSKQYCNTEVNLEPYNGQEIEYWFELEDLAGGFDDSKHVELAVDTTFPVLNNESFWKQGVGRYNKYIYFTFNVTEENFDSIIYTYKDSRGKERKRKLCSRLRDDICEKKKTFRRGNHTIDIQITDEAGNPIERRIEFEVDY